ncbi:MAG: hypothetical protein IKR11_09790 [Solobacterium sp.]|nr:hypothetical protein [Solobacterium sp.]
MDYDEITDEQKRQEEIREINKKLVNTNTNLILKIILCLVLIGFIIYIQIACPSMGATEADMRYLTRVSLLCLLVGVPYGIYIIYQLIKTKKELKDKLSEYDEVQRES